MVLRFEVRKPNFEQLTPNCFVVRGEIGSLLKSVHFNVSDFKEVVDCGNRVNLIMAKQNTRVIKLLEILKVTKRNHNENFRR